MKRDKLHNKMQGYLTKCISRTLATDELNHLIDLCQPQWVSVEQDTLLRRAKEYAEFYENTRNFNTLGFFNDLIQFLEQPLLSPPIESKPFNPHSPDCELRKE